MLLNSTPENDIAYRLRAWRKDVLKMSQVRFAEVTGVHLSAIRKYEGRHSLPSRESLLAFAGTGVNLHWLLTGEGDMRAPANASDRALKTEADAELVHRLMVIEGLLTDIQADKRSAVLEETISIAKKAVRGCF